MILERNKNILQNFNTKDNSMKLKKLKKIRLKRAALFDEQITNVPNPSTPRDRLIID